MSYLYAGQEAEACRLKGENERLQRELEDARYKQERQREQDYRQDIERREERRQQAIAELHEASDWPEAFRKGLILARREMLLEDRHNQEFASEEGFQPETFFAAWTREIERAQTLYREVMVEIEAKIRKLREDALAAVADRLAAEFGEDETVTALRENNPAFLVEW